MKTRGQFDDCDTMDQLNAKWEILYNDLEKDSEQMDSLEYDLHYSDMREAFVERVRVLRRGDGASEGEKVTISASRRARASGQDYLMLTDGEGVNYLVAVAGFDGAAVNNPDILVGKTGIMTPNDEFIAD